MTRRVITTVVLGLLVSAVARFGYEKLAALRAETARKAVVPPALLVRAERAVVQDYQEVLRGFGRATPLRKAEVVAEVEGVIRYVSPLLESGTPVEGPQLEDGAPPRDLPVLVRLDDRDLKDVLARTEAEVAVARAEIARIEANRKSLGKRLVVADEELETATRELRRIAGLVPKTLSQSELDAQRIQVNARQRQRILIQALANENAEARVSALAALDVRTRAVALARRNLERTAIRAPFPGRIGHRHVSDGERVRIGDPLFTIVDLSRVEVPVALPARRFTEVKAGTKATARLPGTSDVLWQGTISRVAPTINAEDRTFFAYVVLPGVPTSNPAPPGAHLLIEVYGRLHAGVVPVPRPAFLGDRLFVARPESGSDEAVIEIRTPKVQRLLPGVALVADGLSDGEFYLLTNIESVAEGSRVRLATELPDAAAGAPPTTDVENGGAER